MNKMYHPCCVCEKPAHRECKICPTFYCSKKCESQDKTNHKRVCKKKAEFSSQFHQFLSVFTGFAMKTQTIICNDTIYEQNDIFYVFKDCQERLGNGVFILVLPSIEEANNMILGKIPFKIDYGASVFDEKYQKDGLQRIRQQISSSEDEYVIFHILIPHNFDDQCDCRIFGFGKSHKKTVEKHELIKKHVLDNWKSQIDFFKNTKEKMILQSFICDVKDDPKLASLDYLVIHLVYVNGTLYMSVSDTRHVILSEQNIIFGKHVKDVSLCPNKTDPMTHVEWKNGKTIKLFSSLKVNKCASCLIFEEHMKKCGRCEQVFYCNKDCQQKDWHKHKNNCPKQTN